MQKARDINQSMKSNRMSFENYHYQLKPPHFDFFKGEMDLEKRIPTGED